MPGRWLIYFFVYACPAIALSEAGALLWMALR